MLLFLACLCSFMPYAQGQTNATSADTNNISYQRQLKDYRSGIKNYAQMPKLARAAFASKDTSMAKKVADDYINNYLADQPTNSIFTKSNIDFIQSFWSQVHYGSKIYEVFINQSAKVDSCRSQPGFSKRITTWILNADIQSAIAAQLAVSDSTKEPNWKSINMIVEQKYGKASVTKNMVDARIKWYYAHRQWQQIGEWTIKKIDLFGLDTVGMARVYFNNSIYLTFVLHNQELQYYGKAAFYLKQVVDNHPSDFQMVDTYACLLYKMGAVKEALSWEKKAVKLSNNQQGLVETFNKMKNGQKIN
ncbi:MAG: hypothetical protein V4577_04570 [Bacteroidota bacterium]